MFEFTVLVIERQLLHNILAHYNRDLLDVL